MPGFVRTHSLVARGPMSVLALIPALALLPSLWALAGGASAPMPAAAGPAPHRQDTPPVVLEPGQRCVECHGDLLQGHRVHGPVADMRCGACHDQLAPDRHVFGAVEPGRHCVACHELPMRAVVHQPVVEKQCLVCHTPHHSERRYLLRAESDVELCAGCHAEQGGAGKVSVHGALERGCVACHSPHSSHEPELLKRTGNEACLGCHQELAQGLAAPRFAHAPVAEDCQTCHDPHASDHPALLDSDTTSLCVRCHEGHDPTAWAFVHGAMAETGCVACHPPHSSARSHLLEQEGNAGCLRCHDTMRELLAAPGVVHEPVEQDCGRCHDPHGGERAFQLRQGATTCLDCHAEKAHAESGQNLFHGTFRDQEDCRKCHGIHAAPHPGLLERPAAEVCLDCHAKPLVGRAGRTVANVAAELKGLTHLHGPVAEGDCGSCHDPHDATRPHLLRGSYTEALYAPFASATYELCFGCHDAAAFTTPETETLTAFRDGATNLHYLHVHKDPKGRTCRACHPSHGSHQTRLIQDTVPFGGWEIPLRFKSLPKGGSCAPGCHAPQEYDNGGFSLGYPAPGNPLRGPSPPPRKGASVNGSPPSLTPPS